MKLGIGIVEFPWPTAEIGPRAASIARVADEAGADSLWVMDHFFQIRVTGLPPESPMLEAYGLLGFLGGQTRRIRLGTLVTSVSYRHPGVLIKTVTSLDVLTGGRMYFGVGAGAPFNAEPQGPGTAFEAEGLGIPFGSLAERFERLEETLQIAHQMWRGDDSPYEGEHYRLVRPLNSPDSLQRPHPPILIGGGGERKTLRLVARYADACNLFDFPGTEYETSIEHKLAVLREHCESVGRDYAEIEKTVASNPDFGDDRKAGASALLAHLHELAELGIDHVLISPRGGWDEATLDAVTAILPDVHAI
ncbi:MAG: LLM class F420-dependent oxidoreductase [Streptosporangiaceae bacterium]|nr:LLM class F420-dependent oxidoreductase [Streptosporangiaceae bacterium]